MNQFRQVINIEDMSRTHYPGNTGEVYLSPSFSLSHVLLKTRIELEPTEKTHLKGAQYPS
jgi:hypothetical protein